MKRIPGRDRNCNAQSLRNLLFNLHQAEHVRNLGGWIVIDEQVEIAIGPPGAASARSEDKKSRRAFSRRAASYVFKTLVRSAFSMNIAAT
jgi:hypothetical protein